MVSGPGGLAAWSLGIPVVLHEQNGIAGLTNARAIMKRFQPDVVLGMGRLSFPGLAVWRRGRWGSRWSSTSKTALPA
ncbi:hypothetical protein CQA77_30115 [Klebsiella pneumoniae]|nr:hypothetical protein CQA77_30115 [Klebsiella pneumoniae]